jgi:hypothetical protein
MAVLVLLCLVLAAFAAMLIVTFVIGLVKGPAPDKPAPHLAGTASMRPLGRVAGVYGLFVTVVSLATGQRGSVCATTPFSAYAGTAAGYAARPGAAIQTDGAVQACAPHPSTVQWTWHLLMRLPGPILWATVLLMIWQLVRAAQRNGPFTARIAAIMWRLGLVVLIGAAIAGAISELGSDLLVRTLMVNPPYLGWGMSLDVLYGAVRALLPVPLLAGAALLSFARIIRAGVVLDEEVRATV